MEHGSAVVRRGEISPPEDAHRCRLCGTFPPFLRGGQGGFRFNTLKIPLNPPLEKGGL